MNILFWLLDINYELINDVPEIRLWGIDGKGNRILVIDRNFSSYFYLLPQENVNPETLVDAVKAQRSRLPLILDVEAVDRSYFGKPTKAIKVTCKNPDLIPKYAKEFAKLDGIKECLEEDIRYSSRYLIDNDMAPCGWHEIEVEEIKNELGVKADKVYLAQSFPKPIEKTELPKLRILGFSIVCHSKSGTSRPERDPIVIISAATNMEEEKQLVSADSEEKVLEAFIKFIVKFDPDIIVGYATNRQDWPYLLTRAKKLGLSLKVDRSKTEPHTSVYGHVSVTGRANVDFYDFAEDLTEVKVKTLENVADFLGVKKLMERTIIEDIEIPAYWEDIKKRLTLLKYSAENTQSIMGIANAMLDFAIQLSNLVGLPLDHVGTAAVCFRVEWYLLHQAHKLGELAPKRVERPYFPYAGAVVLEPKPGIHEEVTVLDFKAMYPSIMTINNISPDTYIEPKDPIPPSGVNVAPEVGYKFRKEPPGFYKQVLSHLIKARDDILKKMKSLLPQSMDYRILDARQKAVKVITNASYGYCGWIGARWYIKPVAEATTAWGRATILNTVKLAKKMGLEVVYGDTDSIFTKHDPKKIQEISKQIGEEFGLEMKPDKVYMRIIFTEAKKRYAGLLPDGRLDIVGLEVVRGDWAAIAKNVQEKVLETILKENSPAKSTNYVRQCISNLRNKQVPYRDLVIWKTLTKPLEEYEVRAPHVEAAKLLMKAGWELTLGDKIGFVITTGPGKLYEKAKPYTMATYDDIDVDYYVSNQILPAALRILGMFQITEEDLMKTAPQPSLTKFL